MAGGIQFSHRFQALNDEQFRAVTRDPDCHQRILASAGSGKTTTLTARIAWLIEKHEVPPESIVLVTFSRNAANQMGERLEALQGPTDLWIGTFHSLARNLLTRYAPQKLQKLYFVDELVLMGTAWLETTKGRSWVSGLRYIVIDEFQDVNAAQIQMVERMLHPRARLIIVGDDAQNIYTWRGSNVQFILDLHKKIPGLVDDQLRTNYRSSAAIVAAANGVLRHIPSLPWKETMIAARVGASARPEVHFFWRASDETAWVLRRLHELETQHPTWTFAVLSRTNADLFRIEEVLQAKGRPYRLRDVFEDIVITTGPRTLDLVTLHAGKGLEWDCVFLIGCNDETFPASKQPAEILCERRLFYVGVTRAREMLYFSYTKQERALSRFIREIPCTRLLYTGLARYTLSDADRAEGRARLQDVLSALDGNKLQELRAKGCFELIDSAHWKTTALFGGTGLWKVPVWAGTYDKGGDFYRFLRLWVHRLLWKTFEHEEPFHEPALERLIFTLRVYAEEREFFEQWRTEILEMLHVWFSKTLSEPLAVEFHAVKAWADAKNLFWSVQDIVKAVTLLAKLRGQLRPLRFDSYDLNEFRIGSARYMVPTEWRAETLRSWRRVSNRTLGWREVLVDLWRLGALSLCAEGRNAALYRVQEMRDNLTGPELGSFLETLEAALAPWIIGRHPDVQFGLELANQDMFVDQLDFVEGGTFWRICAEGKMDAVAILELAVRTSLARGEGIPLNSVGWMLPLEGTLVQIDLPEQWDRDVAIILGL